MKVRLLSFTWVRGLQDLPPIEALKTLFVAIVLLLHRSWLAMRSVGMDLDYYITWFRAVAANLPR